MFKFLKNRQPKVHPVVDAASSSVLPADHTPQQSNIKRELIRVVLKDTLQRHGIPLSWLGCEVIITPRPPGQEELQIQLVVLKWNEQLLRYAPALQQQLLLALDRFDPSTNHSGCNVSWRFLPDCGCPFMQMPMPSAWLEVAPSQADQDQIPVLDRRHRKRPPKGPVSNPAPPSAQKKGKQPSFSPTQIAPLR